MTEMVDSLGSSRVADLLNAGKVGIIPTDTVYGLAALASDKHAVARLYKLKQRDSKPGTVIAANIEQLIELGIKARYVKAVAQFWPGSVSVIIPSYDLEYVHLGQGGIAMRVTDDPALNTLLLQTGPLLTSSANQPGQPPANTIGGAKQYFGDGVDFYVDGGDLSDHKPSTVIRIVDDAVEVLRQGAVSIDEKTGRIIK